MQIYIPTTNFNTLKIKSQIIILIT